MTIVKPTEVSGCRQLVIECANLKPSERALILCDQATKLEAKVLEGVVLSVTPAVELLCLPAVKMHGQEPPADASEAMKKADVIFCLTSFSLAHSGARKAATDRGARFLSLPDYSSRVLSSKSLQVRFSAFEKLAVKLAQILTESRSVRITSAAGTDFEFSIEGRIGNAAPGIAWAPGSLASPPDIESNIAICEESSNGILVVDGSIPHPSFGVLKETVTIEVERGTIVNIEGNHAEALREFFERAPSQRAKVPAEFGIGLNPCAELTGSMLEDEGTLGTIHIGFGSNSTIGGLNTVSFHLDVVLFDCSVIADDYKLINGGLLALPVPGPSEYLY